MVFNQKPFNGNNRNEMSLPLDNWLSDVRSCYGTISTKKDISWPEISVTSD